MNEMTEERVYFLDDKILVKNTFIASINGVSLSAVRKWKIRATEHKADTSKLYDLDYVNKWHDENISKSKSSRVGNLSYNEKGDAENPYANMPDNSVPKEELERRNEYEKLRKAKLNNEILEGKYVEVDDLDKNMATLAALQLASMSNFEKSAPSSLENKSKAEILPIIQDAHDELTDKLNDLIQKEYNCEHEIEDAIWAMINSLVDGDTVSKIVKRIKG